MSDGQGRLDAVLAETGPVLLDFDGPVCDMYPGDLNSRACDALRQQLRDSGVEVSPQLAEVRDPLAILRHAGAVGQPDLATALDKTLTAIEVEAAHSAPATNGAVDFMQACGQAERPIVIVSNNAVEAIKTYLDLHSGGHLVHAVVGRAHARPELMKPHPRAVTEALQILGRPASECLMVGDSVTDIEVSHAIGLRSVAYVKAPDRWDRLAAAESDAYVDSMTDLAEAVRRGRSTPAEA
jgi:phosphoglycolate phosphatase-like HAD superfamily hydrolase